MNDILIIKINKLNNTASITRSPKATGNILIPKFFIQENIKYKVISIGSYAFENCSIDSLTFPDDSEIEVFVKNFK